MKVRDLLDKFCIVEDDKIIVRFGVMMGKCNINIHKYTTFTLGDTIPDEILDKEVINFFLGGEIDSNILFITVEKKHFKIICLIDFDF